MGYEAEMYHELVHDIKPRLAAIDQPAPESVQSETSEDLLKEEKTAGEGTSTPSVESEQKVTEPVDGAGSYSV